MYTETLDEPVSSSWISINTNGGEKLGASAAQYIDEKEDKTTLTTAHHQFQNKLKEGNETAIFAK